MAKSKTLFFCTECGDEQPKWNGKCLACGAWNSYKQHTVEKTSSAASRSKSFATEKINAPIAISQIEQRTISRADMGYSEVNRVLGGGLVDGSLVLLGGEPGIGKSTLTLQLALKSQNISTLYVSGEESAEQIKLRADRLDLTNDRCYVLSETCLESIFPYVKDIQPDLLIIDSIQTMYSDSIDSSPGSVTQIRECAAMFMRYAKSSATPVFLIGHITKDGVIAGPKILEHIVDVVLQFEGDPNNIYRLLRGVKNRFGATNEIGVFEMGSKGLVEVDNPSDILISNYDEALSGVAIGATIDGLRPYLLETQALVSTAAYGNPQRTTTGFDAKRLSMLLAVVEKRLGFKMGAKDVFLNIAGGFKVNDPGLDLSIVSSVISSLLDINIGKDCCFAAEIGLSGEIRPASRTELRINEAARLGFKRIVVSSYAKKALSKDKFDIEVLFISKIDQLVKLLNN